MMDVIADMKFDSHEEIIRIYDQLFLHPLVVENFSKYFRIRRNKTVDKVNYYVFPEQLRYKYIIAPDGNTAAWMRLFTILYSNSVMLWVNTAKY